MKKIIITLSILILSITGFSQLPINMQNNKVSVDTSGDFTYQLPYCEGNADSISYTITVGNQNAYYKINSTSVTWRVTDGYTCQGDSVRIPITGTYKVELFLSATTSNQHDFIRVRTFVNNIKPTTSVGRFIIVSNGNTSVPVPNYYNANFQLTKGDWLSWHVANLTGARDVVIGDIKIILTKLAKQ